MHRRTFLVSLATLAAAAAKAQSTVRPVRLGWVSAQRSEGLDPYRDALRDGLAAYGLQQGRNLVIEFRFGDDRIERVPDLASELARLPVDVLVAQGVAVPLVAKLALPVPVVFLYSGDPPSAGIAESLSRPRGNLTGISFMAVELNGKRLELLREIVPNLRRVAVVGNPQHPGANLERDDFAAMGARLGIEVDYFSTRSQPELVEAFSAMSRRPPQAISVLSDAFAIQHRHAIQELAIAQRLPWISGWSIFARSGALCSYGPKLTDSYRRLAYYIDRIVKGAKPSELPIERPTSFELLVNLRTARTLGITIPQAVLARADELIG